MQEQGGITQTCLDFCSVVLEYGYTTRSVVGLKNENQELVYYSLLEYIQGSDDINDLRTAV